MSINLDCEERPTPRDNLKDLTRLGMHKRNSIQRDSIRLAKVTQSRLDAIDVRIEKEKTRKIRYSNYEKIRVWNELKDIHRVFVPQYVPPSEIGKARDNANKAATTKAGVNQEVDQKVDKLNRCTISPPSPMRKSSRVVCSNFLKKRDEANLQERNSSTRANTASAKQSGAKRVSVFQPAFLDDDDISENFVRRKRSGTWPLGGGREPAREETRANSQDYVNKLLQVNVEPCVSAPMSVVTNGYFAFKRLLRRRQSATADTQYVRTPRFGANSIEEDDISTNSMLVMPEKSQLKPKELKQKLDVIEKAEYGKISLPEMVTRKTAIPLINYSLGVDSRQGTSGRKSPLLNAGRPPCLTASLSWPDGREPVSPRRRAHSLVCPPRVSTRVDRHDDVRPKTSLVHKQPIHDWGGRKSVTQRVSVQGESQHSRRTPSTGDAYWADDDDDDGDTLLVSSPALPGTFPGMNVKRPSVRPRAFSESAANSTGRLSIQTKRDLGLDLPQTGPTRSPKFSPKRERALSKMEDSSVPKIHLHVPVVTFSDDCKLNSSDDGI